jgi:hypothetical protein
MAASHAAHPGALVTGSYATCSCNMQHVYAWLMWLAMLACSQAFASARKYVLCGTVRKGTVLTAKVALDPTAWTLCLALLAKAV